MNSSLAKVLPHIDADKMVSAVARFSKKYGAAMSRVAWNNGRTVMKIFTTHGAQITTIVEIPEVKSKAHRDGLVRDLLKLGFPQGTTADIMRISQSTVSRIHRK